jgi:hypothetical protein
MFLISCLICIVMAKMMHISCTVTPLSCEYLAIIVKCIWLQSAVFVPATNSWITSMKKKKMVIGVESIFTGVTLCIDILQWPPVKGCIPPEFQVCYDLHQIWTSLPFTLLSQPTVAASLLSPCYCWMRLLLQSQSPKLATVHYLFHISKIVPLRWIALLHMSDNHYFSQCMWSKLVIVCLPTSLHLPHPAAPVVLLFILVHYLSFLPTHS